MTDGYKTGHHQQYPPKTTYVYSNFTPRSLSRAPLWIDEIVSFGQQMTIMEIHNMFQENFFSKDKDEVVCEMKQHLSLYLNTNYDVSHFEALWDLGYLPIRVKAIPEGMTVDEKIAVLTIENTHPDFFWITNYLETIISNLLWKPMTSASIALAYRKILDKWQQKTDKDNAWFVDWQAHDFSMRGMDSLYAVMSSGLGHLTSFSGSDSLPTIHAANKYYKSNGFFVCGSVNATEHSVMCAGSKEGEVETFKRLLDTYTEGILSVVSDTWDLWKVCTQYVLELKDQILSRDGKLVIRPDSGDPQTILCGNELADAGSAQSKGVVECLWDIFGGTINDQGYKVLDSHIGVIYGDSITLDRADNICAALEKKGFASTNVVFGIGSYTYQYNTRDTFGFAMKATYVFVDGEGREIYKDPITDNGMKKSARGFLKVVDGENGRLKLLDRIPIKYAEEGYLKVIYNNGVFKNTVSLAEIKSILINRNAR